MRFLLQSLRFLGTHIEDSGHIDSRLAEEVVGRGRSVGTGLHILQCGNDYRQLFILTLSVQVLYGQAHSGKLLSRLV